MKAMRVELELQMKKLKELRASLEMNRTEFSTYIGIPLRTLDDWENARRQMPDYVLRLLIYRIETEKLLKDNNIMY